jgi:hypothetical protein
MGLPSLAAVCLVSSCLRQPREEDLPGFGKLLGRWESEADTSLELRITRVCCGTRPAIEGRLRWGKAFAVLEAGSYAQMYPVEKPDSGATREYVFELVLAAQAGSICGMDGFVRDRYGTEGFSRPALPESAVLKFAISGMTARGCDSAWTPMEFQGK